MARIALILLLSNSCFGQAMNLLDPNMWFDFPTSANSTSQVTNYLTFGLVEFWEYNHGGPAIYNGGGPTTNVAVTNWVGQIQGIALTNGVAARQPTNSTKGLGFGGSLFGLTNLAINCGTNWAITVICEITDNGTVINSGGGTADLWGNYGNGVLANKQETFVGFGGSGPPKMAQYQAYGADSIGFVTSPSFPLPNNQFFVMTIFNTNASPGGHKGLIYTNGFAMTVSGPGNGYGQTNSFLGYDGYGTGNGDAGFVGFIEAYYLQTNSVPWTPAQVASVVSNIWFYYTNVTGWPQS